MDFRYGFDYSYNYYCHYTVVFPKQYYRTFEYFLLFFPICAFRNFDPAFIRIFYCLFLKKVLNYFITTKGVFKFVT